MKPIELYRREPESISRDLNDLDLSYSHNPFPELGNPFHWFDDEINAKNNKIEIRTYKKFHYDSRRYWHLWSIYFENEPVMIIQNAGREGDDHQRRFITDIDRYYNMVAFIQRLLPQDQFSGNDVVASDRDIENLTSFYGGELDGYFEVSKY